MSRRIRALAWRGRMGSVRIRGVGDLGQVRLGFITCIVGLRRRRRVKVFVRI
jgi:hypothetical protein